MPVHKLTRGGVTCHRWGGHGKVYCGEGSSAKAAKQGRAAYASGYKGRKK